MEPLRRTDAFVHRNVAGEALLIPVRRQAADLQAAFVLNETAEFVYLSLDGRRTAEDLADMMCGRFTVAPEAARGDVDGLLETLCGIEAAR